MLVIGDAKIRVNCKFPVLSCVVALAEDFLFFSPKDQYTCIQGSGNSIRDR